MYALEQQVQRICHVLKVQQRRDGNGTDVEVVVSALVPLTGAAANALRKVGFKVLDLTAAINGACR